MQDTSQARRERVTIEQQPMEGHAMDDIVIKNGLIVDGTGRPGFHGDVGICGDRIAQVGELETIGARILDVEGCVVAPGFIDIHSHTDELVLANPTCESKLTQGVTTEVSGNCGDSPAPRGRKLDEAAYKSWLSEYGIEPCWKSMGEYLSNLDRFPMAINYATFVGHGVVRAGVVGYDDRKATAEELAEMRRLVVQAVKEGAFGLSSGLIYPPGCYGDTEELIELCRGMTEYGGIYSTHMRNEADGVVDAVNEALRIGREAGVGVQISHHKGCGRKAWGLVKDSLAVIDEARAKGFDVWADQYPYVATSTGLGIMLPKWVHDGGREALLSKLRDPEQRCRIKDELLRDMKDGYLADSGGWDSVVVSSVKQEKNHFCEGLNITEIAKRFGKHPIDATMDLLLEENGSVGMMHFVINEDDVAFVMRHSAVVIGSDATARANTGPLSSGKAHPRAYGTFARVLGKYSREDGILTLEEAVAKMTGRTAKRLSMAGRGFLSEGCYADITIFDPNTIMDEATFENPRRHAIGIKYVLVNGEVVLDNGFIADISKRGPGRVLRRGVN